MLTDKNIILCSSVLFVTFIVFSLFFQNAKIYIFGLLFGFVFSILNFRLLKLTLTKAVTLPPNKIKGYVVSRYFIRYILKGVVLFVAFWREDVNAVAVILGLVTINLAIYLLNLFNIVNKKLNKE